MGFCRRCGDIAVGPRCKCGGTSVAPTVKWNETKGFESKTNDDKWTRTYVSPERSLSRSPSRGPTSTDLPSKDGLQRSRSTSPTKRFPRPLSRAGTISGDAAITSRISSHIASTTSRPSSPLKKSVPLPASPSSPTSVAAAAGIIPSPDKGSRLSKVYGSVLQPKESLATYCCAVCASTFPPDATIYPDPSSSFSTTAPTRFLCRPCFIENGGSKGTCPVCNRAVLVLKSEGGFVENSGRVWHKDCFRCESCFKNIGDRPMVDVLGRPCCMECFDDCLNRSTNAGSKTTTPVKTPKKEKDADQSRIGGMQRGSKSREASPTIQELELRLGIAKSREASPELEDLTRRLGEKQVARQSPLAHRTCDASPEASPTSNRRRLSTNDNGGINGTPNGRSLTRQRTNEDLRSSMASEIKTLANSNSTTEPTEAAVEEMKMRFLRGSSGSSASAVASTPLQSSQLQNSATKGASSTASKIAVTPTMKGSSNSYNQRSRTSASSLRRSVSKDAIISKPVDSQQNQKISPPRDFDIPSPTSSLSSLSLLRGHGLDSVRNGLDSMSLCESSVPSTPDLMSDKSSIADSVSPSPQLKYDVFGDYLDNSADGTKNYTRPGDYLEKKVQSPPPSITNQDQFSATDTLESSVLLQEETCGKCGSPLLTKGVGQFVTIPSKGQGSTARPEKYHAACFVCAVCGKSFEQEKGRATFVRDGDRAVHAECAPTHKPPFRTLGSKSMHSAASRTMLPPAVPPLSTQSKSSSQYTSSRYERPPTTAPPTSTSFPRFGSVSTCPGCMKNVSPMERGVVPGPGGTKWHANCLVCGGGVNGAKARSADVKGNLGRYKEDKKTKPGCGKRLDSAAKSDGEGGIWCRECLLLVPVAIRNSPHSSPTRGPIAPSYTGTSSIQAQLTGVTTLARQFTGLGNTVEGPLLRQLTGGGLSPTRQLGMATVTSGTPTIRPRPKSVIGMRGRSIDEGRGVTLIRHMTGSSMGV